MFTTKSKLDILIYFKKLLSLTIEVSERLVQLIVDALLMPLNDATGVLDDLAGLVTALGLRQEINDLVHFVFGEIREQEILFLMNL